MNDEVVVWPLDRMVIARHIVNDTVDGVPLVVCYCALCASGLVFSSFVDGRELSFRVAGVYRRNMLMIDRQTRTLWQQATGRAIHGSLAGRELELLPSEQMPLSGWIAAHPRSLLAWKPDRRETGWAAYRSTKTGGMTPPPRVGSIPVRSWSFNVTGGSFGRSSTPTRRSDLCGERGAPPSR